MFSTYFGRGSKSLRTVLCILLCLNEHLIVYTVGLIHVGVSGVVCSSQIANCVKPSSPETSTIVTSPNPHSNWNGNGNRNGNGSGNGNGNQQPAAPTGSPFIFAWIERYSSSGRCNHCRCRFFRQFFAYRHQQLCQAQLLYCFIESTNSQQPTANCTITKQ